MKTSELIAMLSKAVEKHGDLEARVFWADEEGCMESLPVGNLVLDMKEDSEQVEAFVVTDAETANAFWDSDDQDEHDGDACAADLN